VNAAPRPSKERSMRRLLALAFVVAAAANASAEEFGVRFKEGFRQMRQGDPEAALASFQELLTETPDSELVRYSIASAEYELGLKNFEKGDIQAASEALNRARSQFDELRTASTPFVREESGFASANSIAQIGKHLDEQQAYKDRLDSLSAAVESYESFLAQYPDHEGAATNLNHTSYLLKKMLQNPPPDQQKSEDDKGEGENQDQAQQGDQGDQPQPESPEDQQQQEQDESANDNQSNTPQDQASNSEKTKDQNIEAILQSLENKNQEEQKNLRKAKEAPRVRDGKWW
jgi:tetratricopeptide (TPR) repeat protein